MLSGSCLCGFHRSARPAPCQALHRHPAEDPELSPVTGGAFHPPSVRQMTAMCPFGLFCLGRAGSSLCPLEAEEAPEQQLKSPAAAVQGEAGRLGKGEGHNSQTRPRYPGHMGAGGRGPTKRTGLWGDTSCSQGWPNLPSRLWEAAGSGGRILRLVSSLQRDQQTQEQALALLRQRAQLEVWETRRALDELLFKHRLEVPGCAPTPPSIPPLPCPGHHANLLL